MTFRQSPDFDADGPLILLLVEATIGDAELLNYRLEKAGIAFRLLRVETEEGFRHALEMPVDLIISDFILPQFNVTLALEILKSKKLDIPVIVTSGTINEEIAVAAMQGLEIARMRIKVVHCVFSGNEFKIGFVFTQIDSIGAASIAQYFL